MQAAAHGALRVGAALAGLALLGIPLAHASLVLQTPAPLVFTTDPSGMGLSCTGGPEGMTCVHRIPWNLGFALVALLAGGFAALYGAARRNPTSIACAGLLALSAWGVFFFAALVATAGPTEPWWVPLKMHAATVRTILEAGFLTALVAGVLLAAAAGMRPARAKV